MKKIQSGFTLIELMIVVAIIGILAAIAIPQYQNYVARAQMSEALVLASGGKVALSEYYNTKGVFPTTNTMAGMETTIQGKYVTSVTVGSSSDTAVTGIITVVLDEADTHSLIKTGAMTLTATAGSGSITWACASSATKDITAYIPSSCK
jgi:type IV pilus assembly protein PilA